MAKPERALRRMVARLAELSPPDREAVLDTLDDTQRSRVSAVLGDMQRAGPKPATRIPPAAAAGLSPWLLERAGFSIEGHSPAPALGMVTPHAQDALRSCMAETETTAGNRPETPSFARVGSALAAILRRVAGTA